MDPIFSVYLASIAIIILIVVPFKWFALSTRKTSSEPPRPPGFPVIGNLHQLGRYPHRSLRSLACRCGPLMLLRLGSVPVLVVSSAEMAFDVLKTHDRVFASRPKPKLFYKLLYDGRDVALAPYGESWRQKKMICIVHLLSSKMVRSFQNVREEEINLMLEKIEEASSSASLVNLNEHFVTLTNNVTCRAALGRKYIDGSEGKINVKELLDKLVELAGGFNIGDYIPSLAWIDKIRGLNVQVDNAAKELDDFLENVIEDHLDRQTYDKQSNILDVLLRIQKEKPNGFEIGRDDMKAIILDMFSAGTDTSYAHLEWMMTEIFRHPEVMMKLRDEIRTFSKHKLYISEDEIQDMKYLRAVVKESLRLHPPNPLLVPRESIEDVILKGYSIGAGTQVLINAWALGREVATWGEDAEGFRPERFIDSSVDFRGQHFEFIPFGAGRRICPGIAFALAMNELVLANLVNRFDWKLAKGQEGESDVPETTSFVVHPKFPLIAYASPVTQA